jgi:O-antigen ligase
MCLSLAGVVLDQWEGLGLFGIPYLTFSKTLIVLAAAVLLLRCLMEGERAPLLFPAPALAHLPFSCFCLVSALAFSHSFTNTLQWLIAPLFLPVMSIVLTQFVANQATAIRLAKVFAIFSFFPMFVAGAESVLGHSFGGASETVIVGVRDIFRVAGNFENPNDFVVLMLFSIPLLLLWAYQTPSLSAKILLLASSCFQGFVLLKTYSRSGYLSMGIAIVAIAFFGRKRVRLLAALACLVGIAVLFASPDVRDRLLTLIGVRGDTVGASQAFASLNSRKLLALAAWREFLQYPMLGIGFGNFAAAVKDHSTLILGETAENTYLQIMAEMGMAGLLAFLFFLVVAWKALVVGMERCRGNTRAEAFYIALAAGYCGFAFNSLLDTNFADNLPWVLLPILVHLTPPKRDTECLN